MINVYIPNEEYSNVDDDTKKDLIASGIGTATAIGVALASKQRQLTNVEQMCGKKPKLGKAKIQAWQNCANRTLPKQPLPQSPLPQPTKNDNKMLYIVGGSIVGLGIIALLVYKLRK